MLILSLLIGLLVFVVYTTSAALKFLWQLGYYCCLVLFWKPTRRQYLICKKYHADYREFEKKINEIAETCSVEIVSATDNQVQITMEECFFEYLYYRCYGSCVELKKSVITADKSAKQFLKRAPHSRTPFKLAKN